MGTSGACEIGLRLCGPLRGAASGACEIESSVCVHWKHRDKKRWSFKAAVAETVHPRQHKPCGMALTLVGLAFPGVAMWPQSCWRKQWQQLDTKPFSVSVTPGS